jgi:murein DD-endopeptidase MepM/ murein hydrolase activator NlpD
MRALLVGVVALAAALLGSQPQSAAEYLLPFPVGDSARLIQGPGGRWGHQGPIGFAYDFIRPIGSPVVASRSGRVVGVESRFVDGNRKPGEENYIFVAHGDSTFSRYYHLTRGGVRVAVGDLVKAGDPIGATGNTGASAGPHLHFDVTRSCPEWGCQTIPIRFRNAGADSLQEGKTYRGLVR